MISAEKYAGFLTMLREFFYGMTGYEFERTAIQSKAPLERLFFILVLGDMIGIPVFPPYHSLRLIPYMLPHISKLKRGLLKERDLTDMAEDIG